MKLRIPDNFEVEYEYGTQMSNRPPKGETEPVETMYVRALLGGPSAHVAGRAVLNPSDAFSPRIGRDIALGRALKELRRLSDEEGLALVYELNDEERDLAAKRFIRAFADAQDV